MNALYTFDFEKNIYGALFRHMKETQQFLGFSSSKFNSNYLNRTQGGWIPSIEHAHKKWACCPICNTVQIINHDLKPKRQF